MAATPGIPFDIPGYCIIRPLGQGGMATVYLATQTALGRQVAIKVLAADRTPSEDLIKRFENEARTIARLDHPHIVSVYDVGRASTGQLYYTLPYLPNGDLSERREMQDQREIIAILRPLAQALDYAHEQGVVHRDVKPENVLFDKLNRPLLADFGIALARHASVRVTREGATLGSTGYMSPEQARGLTIDGRSDLYSLGVMAYELLTGDLPFHGPDALAVALAHVEQVVPRLPPTRRHWQAFIDKALAKDPEQRFQNAAALLAALATVETELAAREKTRPVPAWRERLAELPASFWVGASAVAGTGLLLAMLFWPSPPIAPETRFVMPPALTSEAPPGPEDNRSSELQRLLDSAAQQLAQDKLVTPAGDNAAESYLAAVALDGDDARARAGLNAVIQALGKHVDENLRDNKPDDAQRHLEQSYMLADQAKLRDSTSWRDYLDARSAALDERLRLALEASDKAAIGALRPLAESLGRDRPALWQRWQASEAQLASPVATPPVVASNGDDGGPDLVTVPAVLNGHRIDHAFALGRHEVTRGEYAIFARATGRADAHCREAMRPLSRWKKLDWRDPDFAQGDDEPAVCVSWQDAHAYARWLSAKTGATYRLPTETEWTHAMSSVVGDDTCSQGDVADASMGIRLTLASRYKCNDGRAHTAPSGRYRASSIGLHDLIGNVSEWTLDCGVGAPLERLLQSDACPERIFRGTSWRDGPAENVRTHRGSADPETAYTTVGFRVLREIDAGTATAAAAAN